MSLQDLRRRWRDIAFWLFMVVLVSFRAPTWLRSYQKEGRTVPSLELPSVGPAAPVRLLFDPDRGRQVIIFWASGCAPCTLELKRLASAVREGSLPADRILAVSIDSDRNAYEQAQRERAYPFQTAWDPGSAALALGVEVTPTVILLDERGLIHSFSTGASLVGPWRIQRFLQN